MSVISLLLIDPEKLPTLDKIQDEALAGLDPLDFTHPADLIRHTGFLPVKAYGRDTGFEYYFAEVPEGSLPPEALTYGSHHIVTRTGSDFEEGRASLLFLKVVSRLAGGAYVYPDEGIIIAPDDVASYLNEQIEMYGKYIK